MNHKLKEAFLDVLLYLFEYYSEDNDLEEDDDFLNYGPGVVIEHEGLGKGEILSIDQSSSILKLKIKYESGSTSTKMLLKRRNLH